MSRYIDAEYVKAVMINDRLMQGNAEFNLYAQQVEIQVNAMPSIDIVRCVDCVYCNIQNTKYLYAICERHGIEFKPFEDDTRTHGCAWGERKESE